MSMSGKIRLFWWNEIKLQGKHKENYGDLLGKYLVEKISNKKIIWSKPSAFSFNDFFSPIYVTIGSILAHVNKKCIVWGSGIVSKAYPVKNAKFLAVRGPQTRAHLIGCGYEVPELYGDPALLLPRYFNPIVKKKYKLGIVPHYVDFELVNNFYKKDNSVLVIDLMTTNIEETTREFLKCEKIISSSLHGVIVSHAYQIPAVWQKFSNKVFGDDIKYQDYFESVGIRPYESDPIGYDKSVDELMDCFKNITILPKTGDIDDLCTRLMAVCPF